MVQTRAQAAAAAHGYEFFGPVGVTGMSIGLPLLCYLFGFVCNDVSGCPAPVLLHLKSLTLEELKQDIGWPGVEGLINLNAFLGVAGYYLLSFILYAILPAQEVEGTELATGGRLKYRLNAFNSAMVTLTVLAATTVVHGAESPVWTFIWANYFPLLTSNIIISWSLAVFVYVRSFQVKPGNKDLRELAAGGHTGNLIYDWFIGRELNPSVYIPLIGTVELKSFMEIRPGLLGWIILDFAYMARQYHNFGYITDSMCIVVVSQVIYVLDAMWMEPAILTTIDITTDGFGFMLAFGDLVWVPFTYSLQARYLSIYPLRLGLYGCLGVFAVQVLGYYIFRSSNNQKNRFRTDPSDPRVAHLSYIQTKTGSRLLTSGWWGAARHVNYLGDWLMSWAYCLPTGIAGYVIQEVSPFRSSHSDDAAVVYRKDGISAGLEVVPGEAKGWGMLITYFFMLYFAVLLIHRERRDEEKCRRKYGKDWEAYTRIVPSRIVPGIY